LAILATIAKFKYFLVLQPHYRPVEQLALRTTTALEPQVLLDLPMALSVLTAEAIPIG